MSFLSVIKNFIFIVIFLSVDIKISAQSVSSIVKKYDMKLHKSHIVTTPLDFWKQVYKQDTDLSKYTKALERHNKTASAAYNDVVKECLDLPEYQKKWNFDHKSVHKVTEELTKHFCLRDIKGLTNCYKMEILIAMCDDINAVAMPNGVIMIYGGMLLSEQFSYEEIKAVCAHEITHLMLRHIELEIYKYNKKSKRNKMWADIGTLAAMTANAYGQAQMEIYGGVKANYNIENFQKIHQNLVMKAYNGSKMFRYRYSRNQELQADIVGCRYFQFLGGNIDDYISMLTKLGVEDDKFYTEEWDHPKTQFRIDVIKYLRDNCKQ